MVPGSEEFPPISPLQLLLLCPNLPQVLHYLEMPALLPLVGSLSSLALFFLSLPSGLLLIGLNWGHITWSPHILPIDWCYDWLVACFVCRYMVTGVNILLSILSVEKYVGDCMSTWYASYVSLPTTIVCCGQVNSETL